MKVQVSAHNLARSEATESGDACAAEVSGETVIAVLADGAGAARGGAEASRRIVDALVGNYAARPREWTPKRALREFTRLINQTLYQESMTRFAAPELVSTLSVAVVEGDRLVGLNVGDSRVYLARSVEPFHPPGAPLLARDPLAFYRAGFFILLALSLYLLLRLLAS